MFNIEMLASLICPISQLTLNYDPERQCLISADGQYEYPIINGIPVLLPHNAMEE
ncbi:hypothetical protein DZA65_01456 [Dickeya dianthicola]|uniref:Trm112 family protein n=1 Tax=Dickeya dianthicola TaxID=204039 RepID=A0ABX9NSA1_9GAMM|nr:Trm112 family protein [Dickeya dianthicola]MBQ4796719.1 Trm112 family protein [Pectobacterium versatile]AYC18350.1 hypothetical protein DZA65_01456 [Dickeya dianthicola]MBI0439977.1 Trm112 family protein [Dickeya dianthicola]MBI0450715.1 Trm112 family protein [Dickeya dianthicola]MBI0455290.1 Trm112 family protein [Dickeya dianthicola]